MNLIYPRSSWSPRHQDGDLTLGGLASGVTIHHTVTAQLSASSAPADEFEQMRTIEGIGESRFGTGISYNVLVFPSGRAYQGVSFNRRGTHTGGMNSDVRSICFVGNYENSNPTIRQLTTVRKILREGAGRWWTTSAWVKGHRELSQTACPGQHVFRHIASFREALSGADFVSNPVNPLPPLKPGDVVVDGYWGSMTTERLQKILGTVADGVVSSQASVWASKNPGLTSGWSWVRAAKGSLLIRAMQERLRKRGEYKGPVDGLVGPMFFRALQRDLGTPVDGVVSKRSKMVVALQKRLNDGRF